MRGFAFAASSIPELASHFPGGRSSLKGIQGENMSLRETNPPCNLQPWHCLLKEQAVIPGCTQRGRRGRRVDLSASWRRPPSILSGGAEYYPLFTAGTSSVPPRLAWPLSAALQEPLRGSCYCDPGAQAGARAQIGSRAPFFF